MSIAKWGAHILFEGACYAAIVPWMWALVVMVMGWTASFHKRPVPSLLPPFLAFGACGVVACIAGLIFGLLGGRDL